MNDKYLQNFLRRNYHGADDAIVKQVDSTLIPTGLSFCLLVFWV